MKDLKTDDVPNAVLALVKAIDPSQPFPRLVPRHMSQKVPPTFFNSSTHSPRTLANDRLGQHLFRAGTVHQGLL